MTELAVNRTGPQGLLRRRARLGVAGKTVVVMDDGIATGTTMRAALQALRRMRPARLVLAGRRAGRHD